MEGYERGAIVGIKMAIVLAVFLGWFSLWTVFFFIFFALPLGVTGALIGLITSTRAID